MRCSADVTSRRHTTLYHNPGCSKSRAALALLEEAGATITIVRYLDTPPTAAELADLYARAGMSPRDGLRRAERAAAALVDADDATILAAMATDPTLIERPLVATDRGVVLARPPERLLAIL